MQRPRHTSSSSETVATWHFLNLPGSTWDVVAASRMVLDVGCSLSFLIIFAYYITIFIYIYNIHISDVSKAAKALLSSFLDTF